MAKIRGEAKPPAPPRRRPTPPGWFPLSVAVIGFGLLLAPEDIGWTLRVVGATLLAAGSFWLGQDRQHDPADRSRISQLEATLVRMGVLDRELNTRVDIAQALSGRRSGPLASAEEHGADERHDPVERGGPPRRPAPLPDLDAKLPGDD